MRIGLRKNLPQNLTLMCQQQRLLFGQMRARAKRYCIAQIAPLPRMMFLKNELRYLQRVLLFLERFNQFQVKYFPATSDGEKSSQTPHPVLNRQKVRKTQSEFQSGS